MSLHGNPAAMLQTGRQSTAKRPCLDGRPGPEQLQLICQRVARVGSYARFRTIRYNRSSRLRTLVSYLWINDSRAGREEDSA